MRAVRAAPWSTWGASALGGVTRWLAHKTLDASSAPNARAAAVRSVRAWGTACFVGERGQVTLVGSWTFSKQGQAECAEFVAERKVDVERLFTHR